MGGMGKRIRHCPPRMRACVSMRLSRGTMTRRGLPVGARSRAAQGQGPPQSLSRSVRTSIRGLPMPVANRTGLVMLDLPLMEQETFHEM